MLLMYGAGRVGLAVRDLAHSLNIPCDVVTDAHPPSSLDTYIAVIATPGIPPTHHIFQSTKLVSELDFAVRYLPEGFQLHVVTGTDGKSTTAWMLYHALRAVTENPESVFLSWNFEVPLSETVRILREKGLKTGHIVVEVSSFMAWHTGRNMALLGSLPPGERNYGFRAESAIFTNFETDHLNWHPNMQDYFNAKMRVVAPANICLVNTQVQKRAEQLSLRVEMPAGMTSFAGDDSALIWTDGEHLNLDIEIGCLSETQLRGKHNAMNMLSVLAVIIRLGLDPIAAFEALKTVSSLPHRLEPITVSGGIMAIDDSKSTSKQSLLAALETFPKRDQILLLAGGQDKGDNFSDIGYYLKDRVRRLALIGQTAKAFEAGIGEAKVETKIFTTLEDATTWLYEWSRQGDVILLSPGCASLDMFVSYLDRAERFRSIVAKSHPK